MMAKQQNEEEINRSLEEAEERDLCEVSVDQITDNLYLGNLACARQRAVLTNLGITHILTIDVVPLPRSIYGMNDIIYQYVQLADVPMDDVITHLPGCLAFIKDAIAGGGTVLVHCYFGVSRSAAVVIAYIMETSRMTYDAAFRFVKSKRSFIGPNAGFVAQLKLFQRMEYVINREDPVYKQFRLKMAGQKLKQVKILPQLFADLVKPDPGLARERPDPIAYRCKKCRRVVASQRNIIPHLPKPVKVEMAKKGLKPQPSKPPGLQCAENGQMLIEKLKNLACQILDSGETPGQSTSQSECEERPGHLDGYTEQCVVDSSIVAQDAPDACRLMWFVEPMAWMERVTHDAHGKLYCPKCRNKIGSFSWVCGCTCPCGQKVAPAFYLVPSKVEWSNIVQNVQVTV